MNLVHLHDKTFRHYIPANQIQKAVDTVAEQMNRELKDEPQPLFLSVLNGAFMFTADLIRKLKFDLELSFIKVSSYSGTQSTGEVNEIIGLNTSVEGRTVVIIEDIVDTGVTIECLAEILKKHHPKQVQVCTLLLKPDQYKKSLYLDYIGLKIPNAFIVGYGLDYNSLGRHLPDIYVIEPNNS